MNRGRNQGFTLVELLLALSFISALLLAIAVTIIQLGNTYNRGMTLKEVNQTSRTLSDEFQRTFSASSAFPITSSTYIQTTTGSAAISGRLCTGQSTYLWNYAQPLARQNDANLIGYAGNPGKAVQLVKVPDAGRIYCETRNPGNTLVTKNIREVDAASAVELLSGGDRKLALHQLMVVAGATDSVTGQQLYRLTYTIGTGDVAALTNDRSACLPPSEQTSDFRYCAVQQFNLVLRAGNRVN